METIADFGDLCGECPVWDADAETLYWTDCVGQRFQSYSAKCKTAQILKTGLEINGFRLNDAGGYTITNNGGIWLWDGIADPILIVSEVEGASCQMNDCVADPTGRLVSGSCFYNPNESYERGKLIQIDTRGKARVLDEGFELANGLGFSPDGRTLYFADSVARRIYSYDYNPKTGDLGHRRIFVQVPLTEGLPDGLAVDEEGFVWSAQWYGSCIVRYDPDGKVQNRIITPAKQTSSLAFGGSDLDTLFVTSAGRSEPMPVMPPGYDAENGYFGGRLYAVHAGVKGRRQEKTAI